MMISFFLFALRRYARFGSYVAVFLAGVGFSIQGAYFWVPLAISVVLGSLCAYEQRPRKDKKKASDHDAFSAAQAAMVSAYMAQMLSKDKDKREDG